MKFKLTVSAKGKVVRTHYFATYSAAKFEAKGLKAMGFRCTIEECSE